MKTKLLRTTAFLSSLCFFGLSGVMNAQTNFLWAKQFGGRTSYTQATSVVVDASGNVYSAGSFSDTIDFDPGAGVFNLIPTESSWGGFSQDIYVSKLDASGNFVWAKRIGGEDWDQLNGMGIDGDGNIYLSGSFSNTMDFDPGSGIFELTPHPSMWGGYSADVYITKWDASGNFIWAKAFGGEGWDQANSMAVDASGNVYTTGGFSDSVDFDPGTGVHTLTPAPSTWGGFSQDVYISKLDASGNFVWAKSFGGTEYDQAGGIAVDPNGNVLSTGGFYGTVDFDPGADVDTLTSTTDDYGYSSEDIFIIKLNSSGDHVWAKSMGGPSYEQGSVITTYSNGDVYSAGTFQGTVDFDPGPGNFTLTPAGDYNNDIYISKLHPNGAFAWIKELGGPSYESVYSIDVDNLRNVYTSGGFEGTADFNPGSEVYNLTSGGTYDQDIFVSKLDGAGFFLWADGVGGHGYDASTAVTIDPAGNVYAAGYFSDTVDFDPGAGVFDMISTPSSWGGFNNDAFIMKMHNSNVGISESAISANTSDFEVYPNPNNGQFNLKANLASDEKLSIEIVDITGQIIKSIDRTKFNAGSNSVSINASELSSGIYFLKIYNETVNNVSKFIINK